MRLERLRFVQPVAASISRAGVRSQDDLVVRYAGREFPALPTGAAPRDILHGERIWLETPSQNPQDIDTRLFDDEMSAATRRRMRG